jgi:hypothetical protein
MGCIEVESIRLFGPASADEIEQRQAFQRLEPGPKFNVLVSRLETGSSRIAIADFSPSLGAPAIGLIVAMQLVSFFDWLDRQLRMPEMRSDQLLAIEPNQHRASQRIA